MVFSLWILLFTRRVYGWTYSNQWAWGGDCRGKSQSPVELPQRLFLEKRDEGELEFHYNRTTPPAQLIDNGKFLEIRFSIAPGYAIWRKKNYHLKRIEFHSISYGTGHNVKYMGDPLAEYLLEHHTLEMEFIHIGPKGGQIVLSVLCDGMGQSHSPWFDALVEDFTFLRLSASSRVNQIDMISPPDMFEFANPQNYDTPDWDMFWDYYGSLTSPPCTEGVRRFVCGDEFPMGKAFLDAIERFETMIGNARSIQPTYDRMIHYNSTHWSEPKPFDIFSILIPAAIVCGNIIALCICYKIACTEPKTEDDILLGNAIWI